MFLNECSKLNKKCFWVNQIASSVKKASEKQTLQFQNEIISLNFIYSNESDENYYSFSRRFRESFLSSENRLSKKESSDSFGSDYLDLEIYNQANDAKDYEPFNYNPPSKKSFIYEEVVSSYQNNTIIENNKNCFSNDLEPHQYEEVIIFKKKALNHYKLITCVIEDHLNKKDHPLNSIKEKFVQEYSNFFQEKRENSAVVNKNEKFDIMVANLIEFIRIFQHAVVIFYGLVNTKAFIKSMTYFTQENLLEFITSLFINNEKIYELLIKASYQLNSEIEEKIEKNYQIFKNLPPEAFGISKHFCLNYKTKNFFKGEEETLNIFKVKELSEPNFDPIIERKITWDINPDFQNENSAFPLKYPLTLKEYCVGFQKQTKLEEKNKISGSIFSKEDFCKNIKKDLLDKTLILSVQKKNYDSKIKNNTSNINDFPYDSAISNLKKIKKMKSPIHKLKNILKTAVLIIECIKKFYENFQRSFNDEINSDEIMAILIYICCKGEITTLYSQCALVESFLTNQLSSSVAGYYLITLKASLEYIGSEEMLIKSSVIQKN